LLTFLSFFFDRSREVRGITGEEILMDLVFPFFDAYNERRDLASKATYG
jgi:hypothetical protein